MDAREFTRPLAAEHMDDFVRATYPDEQPMGSSYIGSSIDTHTHECRDCGQDIVCTGDGERCWGGGNEGCVCEYDTDEGRTGAPDDSMFRPPQS